MTLIPPLVIFLDDCEIEYLGRAKASSKGGSFLVIVKKDNTVVIHNLEKGMRPTYYNPSEDLRIKLENKNLFLTSTSKKQEKLIVKGNISQLMDLKDDISYQPRDFSAITGTEKAIVEEIRKKPSLVGLRKKDFEGTEVRISSGRIDLLFKDLVIEVKKRAGARTFDQLSRYLRGSKKNKGIIVCIKATSTLKETVEKSSNISLIERPQWGKFDKELPKENY